MLLRSKIGAIKFIIAFTLCLICLSLLMPIHAMGQTTSLSVAVTYDIEEAQDGDIVCATPEGYGLCQAGYDPSMYGVVSITPALSLTNTSLNNAKPVITSGKAYVRVSSINGPIKKGEYVSSSPKTGVAMKANKSGYVLGTALDDYDSSDPDNIGTIVVSLGIKPAVLTPGAAANLMELIRQGIDAAFYSPISALRYILAAFIVAISFTLGFIYFGRIAKSGVDALGRNPLASRAIQIGIFMNISFMIVIVAVGMGIAYLILI